MTRANYSALQRVLTCLENKEPDRVPFFLLCTMHGARELNLSIREYFSKPEYVVEGQLRLRDKYRHDCFYAFFYAPVEVEAWGAEVIFFDDGPPNSGEPVIQRFEDITKLQPPDVRNSACLVKVLTAIEQLKEKGGPAVPIIGVVMSPFSLPVMQMGFDNYFELIYHHPMALERLMQVNASFCVEWANAQLEAGATAICYFDPVASGSIVPKDIYLQTGFPIARQTLSKIDGPTATHLASAPCKSILPELVQTGTAVVGVSALEDLAEVKAAADGRLTVLGNLNGIEMSHWTPAQAEEMVKAAIAKAGPGGGFILADNHGEIPWQVSDDVLLAVSEAVRKWGRYPLDWIDI